MKNIFVIAVLCAILTGCVSVDYVGQRLPAREDGEYVTIYPSMEEVPAEWKILGRGKVVAPNGYDLDKLDALLSEKANEVGADAVAISSKKRVVIGSDNNLKSSFNRPNGSWSFGSRDFSGDQIYTDSFGTRSDLNTVKTDRYRVYYQVVFLTKVDVTKKDAPTLDQ